MSVVDFSGYKPKTPGYINHEKQDMTKLQTSAYNTVQMFEPFQIGTKTEVLCLAPGPI